MYLRGLLIKNGFSNIIIVWNIIVCTRCCYNLKTISENAFSMAVVDNRTNSNTLNTSYGCRSVFKIYYWNSPATGSHLYTNIFVIVVNSLFALVGTVANTLIITAYGKNKKLRVWPSLLFAVLAVTDLTVTGLEQPLYIVFKIKEIYATDRCLLLTLIGTLTNICCGLSLVTTFVISVQSFLTLAYPYQNMVSPARVSFVLVNAWLALILFPLFAVFNFIGHKTILIVDTVLVFSLVVIIILIWSWIHRLTSRHRNAITAVQTPSNWLPEAMGRKRFRSTITCHLIAGSVLVCYLPDVVLLICQSRGLSSFALLKLVTPWTSTVLYSNSVLNPLLLFWRKRDLRQTVRRLIFKNTLENINTNTDSMLS